MSETYRSSDEAWERMHQIHGAALNGCSLTGREKVFEEIVLHLPNGQLIKLENVAIQRNLTTGQ